MAKTGATSIHTGRVGLDTLVRAAGDALALVGVVAGCVSLFLHGWVHVTVALAPRGPGGTLVQRLGGEADTQITAIAAREVNAAIAPTLWQYPSHGFQVLFALLLIAAAGIVLGPMTPPRWRTAARLGAVVASAASAILVAVAFARIGARIGDLSERIAAAMQGNALVRQSLAATGSTPRVSGGPGWPMIVVALGVALALLGAAAGLIVTLRHDGLAAILPRTRQKRGERGEVAVGSAGRAATVSDDGSAADAHRDAPAV